MEEETARSIPAERMGALSCLSHLVGGQIVAPLKVKEKVIGVLSVNRKKKKKDFTQDELDVITLTAEQTAPTIENAKLAEKVNIQFMETIRTLSGAVEVKDPYTKGHSEAVTKYAVEVAKEMGFSQEEVRNIEIAGTLHDIGKIGIPEQILNKPGKSYG